MSIKVIPGNFTVGQFLRLPVTIIPAHATHKTWIVEDVSGGTVIKSGDRIVAFTSQAGTLQFDIAVLGGACSEDFTKTFQIAFVDPVPIPDKDYIDESETALLIDHVTAALITPVLADTSEAASLTDRLEITVIDTSPQLVSTFETASLTDHLTAILDSPVPADTSETASMQDSVSITLWNPHS